MDVSNPFKIALLKPGNMSDKMDARQLAARLRLAAYLTGKEKSPSS